MLPYKNIVDTNTLSRSTGRYQRTAAFFKELSTQNRPSNQGASSEYANPRETHKGTDSISLTFEGMRLDSSQQNSRAGSQRASVIQQQVHLLSPSDMRLMRRRLNEDKGKDFPTQRPLTNTTLDPKLSFPRNQLHQNAGIPRDSSGGNSALGTGASELPQAYKSTTMGDLTRPYNTLMKLESESDHSVSFATPKIETQQRNVPGRRLTQKQLVGISRPDITRSFHQPHSLIEQLLARPTGSMTVFCENSESLSKITSGVTHRQGDLKPHTQRPVVGEPTDEVHISDQFHISSQGVSGASHTNKLQVGLAYTENPEPPLSLRSTPPKDTVEPVQPQYHQIKYESSIVFSHTESPHTDETDYLLEKLMLETQIRSVDAEIEEDNRCLLQLREVISDLRDAQEDLIHAKEKESSYVKQKYAKSRQILEQTLAFELAGFMQIYDSLKAKTTVI